MLNGFIPALERYHRHSVSNLRLEVFGIEFDRALEILDRLLVFASSSQNRTDAVECRDRVWIGVKDLFCFSQRFCRAALFIKDGSDAFMGSRFGKSRLFVRCLPIEFQRAVEILLFLQFSSKTLMRNVIAFGNFVGMCE